jgi:2-hydroxy-6-oxo-6-(2'-carboxyphenyl)-hexa-2,4-dienoate hydrolase
MNANSKFVNVDGIRTRYFEGGSGEPMLLVHGGNFGSNVSALAWTPIFDHLAQHFHVYAIDKLGQGYTDNPQSDDDYTMKATIQHVYRFLETLGIQKVHLVGNSRGAMPVARISVDHPEMVQSLIMFNSRTLAPEDPALASRTTQGGPSSAEPPTKESVRLSASRTAYRTDYITDEYVEGRLKITLLPKIQEAAERLRVLTSQWVERNPQRIEENSGLRVRWWYYDFKQETLDRIQAGHLKAPTLIIWGTNDSSAPYSLGINLYKAVGSALSRARLHFVNHCGHRAFAEYPEEMTRLMVSFIKES